MTSSHLTSPSAEQYRVGSLRRLLKEGVSRGSMRGVIGAFVETVSVWDDSQVFGYAPGVHGGFFKYVSPIGADPVATPDDLEEAGVPSHPAMVRVAPADRASFQAPSDSDILIRRLTTESGASWLLVFVGQIDAYHESRFTFYSDLLRNALNDLTLTTLTRLVTAITPHVFDEPLQVTAERALFEVTTMVGSGRAALIVTSSGGARVLGVGAADLLSEIEGQSEPDRLVATTHSPSDGTRVTVVVARKAGRFTGHERRVLEATVAILRPWVGGALRRRD